jgi:hypothetical protein
MANHRNRCAELAQHLDDTLDFTISSETRKYLKALISTVRSELAEPEPERLTVQEISNLPQHGENYIAEDRDGEIQLDGYFSRADLQQLADSIPTNRSNSNA